MDSKKTFYSELTKYRAYILVAVVLIFFLLLINILYLMGFKLGQDGQNMFFKISRKENREDIAALKKTFSVKMDSSRRAMQELTKKLSQTENQNKTYQITNTTLAKELERQSLFIKDVLQKEVHDGVIELSRESKALRREVASNRQQNRLQVDAKNQLISIFRDSLSSRQSKPDPHRLRVINYTEKNKWFDIHGTMQDTALTFNPSFISRFEIGFDKQTTSTGFLGLRKRDVYTIKVKDKNPYNRTGQVEKVIKEQDAITYGAEPYHRERKRINSRPKF